MDKLLRPREAADMLNIRLGTIYKFAAALELPSTKVGGALRFSQQQLEEYVTKNTRGARE